MLHLASVAGGASGLVRPLVVGRRGAILLVPESVFLPDEGLRRQSGAWLRLLRLFLRLRGRRALDGVVWNIPLARLQDGEQAANLGLAARRRYVELTQRLGLSLPVYVVITGLEDLPGFQELLAALPEEARERALGWSSPFAAEAAWQSRWCEQALEEITATLTESIVELGTLRGQVDNELYCLPPRLESLRGSLQALLEPVFQGNARGEAPRFRGLYLSGSEAAGAAADDVLPAVDAPRRRSSFASQLWARRIACRGRPGPGGAAHPPAAPALAAQDRPRRVVPVPALGRPDDLGLARRAARRR